jgi:hypothetical protein
MRLVKLSENLLVNADEITALEGGKGTDKKGILVHVGEKTFMSKVPPKELLQSIMFGGNSNHDQFFAG